MACSAGIQSGDQFEVNVQRDLDAPAESFDIFRDVTVSGRYWWTSGTFSMRHHPLGRSATASIFSTGQFHDGHSTAAGWWRFALEGMSSSEQRIRSRRLACLAGSSPHDS